MDFDRPALAHGVNLLVGLPLEIHAVGIDVEQGGELKPQFLLPRADLRSFQNHGRVEVADFKARLIDPASGGVEEPPAVGPIVGRVGVGKELPDVFLTEGTEQGVGDRVQEGITIGVTDRPAVMLEREASKHERPARAIRSDRLEAVEVVSVTDSKGRGDLRHRGRL